MCRSRPCGRGERWGGGTEGGSLAVGLKGNGAHVRIPRPLLESLPRNVWARQGCVFRFSTKARIGTRASLRYPRAKRPLTLPSPPGEGTRERISLKGNAPHSRKKAARGQSGTWDMTGRRGGNEFPLPGGEGRVRGLFARGRLEDALFPIRALAEKRKTHPCLAHTFLGTLSNNGRGIRTCTPAELVRRTLLAKGEENVQE